MEYLILFLPLIGAIISGFFWKSVGQQVNVIIFKFNGFSFSYVIFTNLL